jgi:PhnB protein
MPYKPERYTSVAPYLIVDGAMRTIEFLVDVFGAERLRIFTAPDGRLKHGEVRIDDTVVMIADSIEGWPPIASNVHVYVADVDAVHRRAIAAGATSVQEPMQKEDDDRRGGFRDAGGTTWWVATQVGPKP